MTVLFAISLSLLWPLAPGANNVATAGQSGQDIRQLQPDKPIEREMGGGQADTYQMTLAAGQFLSVLVDQRGIDVVLTLYGPDGKLLGEVDSPNGTQGPESISIVAALSGSYRLAIRALEKTAAAGRYEVKIEELRTATARDRSRVSAERAFTEGERLKVQGTAEALRQSIKKYEEALLLWRAIGNRSAEALTLFPMGEAFNLIGDYQKALDSYQQGLPLMRAMGQHGPEILTLNYISQTYFTLGEKQKALDYYNQALTRSQTMGDRSWEAFTLANIGKIYSSLGEKKKALDYYSQALNIDRAMSDRTREAASLLDMGKLYFSLGETRNALDHLGQALALGRATGYRPWEAFALVDMAKVYDWSGEKQKALDYFDQALKVHQAISNREGEAYTLLDIGKVHSSLGDYQKALNYFHQALILWRTIGNRTGEAYALLDTGKIDYLLGDYQKTFDYFDQSLQIARAIGSRDMEASTLLDIARAHRDRGNLIEARARIEAALNIIESMRSKIASQELRTSYFATVQTYYEFYIDLLMRLHKERPSEGHDAAALQGSERARARALLELLAEANVNIRQGADPPLLERERKLAQQFNAQAQLLARQNTAEQLAAFNREINQLEIDYEQTQAEIRRTSPRYAALTQPQPLGLKEVQQQLDPDTLLLEYSLGEDRSYLWAITNNSLASYELPKEAQIKGAVTQVLDLLTMRGRVMKGETPPQKQQRVAQAEAQLPATVQQLSQMLLGPVAEHLGSKRLVIVADGALQYVPFAALPLPRVSGQLSVVSRQTTDHLPRTTDKYQPLIVSHEIISLPSVSTLAVQRHELAGRKPAPNLLAVIADPVFAATDERMKTVALNASAPQPETQTASSTAGLDSTRIIEHLAEESPAGNSRTLRIPRLPFTRREADQIIAVAPGSTNLKATDFKANRATVTSGELSQYRYVHFATHGYLDSERPGLSALVFSMVDEQGKPQDGFLRANEIYNLNLPAELVVLSACQTGLGKEIKGEGLIGLTRGFMYAGAARVVVSLWSVNDKATSELMAKFYQKMLKENQRPAAALRAAQVELWKQKQWQSPYYWAPFVLQGEWK